MKVTKDSLVEASDRAAATRAQLDAALAETRQQLSPAQLRSNAIGTVRQKLSQADAGVRTAIRQHPVAATSLVAAAAAIALYGPARTLFAARGRIGAAGGQIRNAFSQFMTFCRDRIKRSTDRD